MRSRVRFHVLGTKSMPLLFWQGKDYYALGFLLIESYVTSLINTYTGRIGAISLLLDVSQR